MSVRLSGLADQDLLSIAAYVGARDRIVARDLLNRFQARLTQLARFPELGRTRSDIADDVRGLLVSPYIVIYRIEPSGVLVLRIFHTSRDLRDTALQ